MKKLLLVGSGPMAVEYNKVLNSLGVEYTVVCRKESSANNFYEKSGLMPLIGGVESLDKKSLINYDFAIVATEVDNLASVSKYLFENGVERILIEKPAGLSVSEIKGLNEAATKSSSKGYVAYNRRFYASVQLAKKIIYEDGGILSAFFEFTERSYLIKDSNKTIATKQNWLVANSSHVIDMFISLCGIPKDICSFKAGFLDWHNNSSIFTGAGITNKGIPFSYHANWESAGGWGLEVFTKKRKLIFRPLERLKQLELGVAELAELDYDYSFDISFKPGLFKMVVAFLNDDENNLLGLESHLENFSVYETILKGQVV